MSPGWIHSDTAAASQQVSKARFDYSALNTDVVMICAALQLPSSRQPQSLLLRLFDEKGCVRISGASLCLEVDDDVGTDRGINLRQ